MPRDEWWTKIRDTKEKYIERTTDITEHDANMTQWTVKIPKINTSIGFNLAFSFLLDFQLNVDLHFTFDEISLTSLEDLESMIDLDTLNFLGYTSLDELQFDLGFENLDFLFPEGAHYDVDKYGEKYYYNELVWTKIDKAYYGETKYGKSMYDPPEVTFRDLKRFVWNLRYLTTHKSIPDVKNKGEVLKNIVSTYREILSAKGISEKYIDKMVEAILETEGKIINSGYVGFTVVGVSKVAKPASSLRYKGAVSYARSIEDYTTQKEVKTKYPYETLVNNARVNYARVIPIAGAYRDLMLRPLAKRVAERVKRFKMRSGKAPITKGLDVEVRPEIREITKNIEPPKYTVPQRAFFLYNREKFEWEGGKHQARLQHIMERIKPILNKYGIPANMRLGYHSFAKEYVYMHYKPHRKHKQWKKLLSDEDLIKKYKKMGCDEEVLRVILSVISPFKKVADAE